MYAIVIGDHDAMQRFITDTQADAYKVLLKYCNLITRGQIQLCEIPNFVLADCDYFSMNTICAMCSLRMLLNYSVILVKKYTFPDFSRRLVLLRLEEGPLVVECGDESLERTKKLLLIRNSYSVH